MKTNDGAAATHNQIKELAMQISAIIDQAPADIVGDLRFLSVSLIAPEYKKGGRDSGVMQIGINVPGGVKQINGVHGGTITGDSFVYKVLEMGKLKTVKEKLKNIHCFNA